MLYAMTHDGRRVRAAKGAEAACPHCRAELVAKCGAIKVHHWAHRRAGGCPYSHGMTAWHYAWLAAYERLADRGWRIEHFFKSVRFDAYHPELAQAVEFQRIVDPDYVRRKVQLCREEGIRLSWLINAAVFRNFTYAPRFEDEPCDTLFSTRQCRRKLLIMLEEHIEYPSAAFHIDFTDPASLPKYVADHFRSLAWPSPRQCLPDEPHLMKPGIYQIRDMPLARDGHHRTSCVLRLKHHPIRHIVPQ